MSDKKLNVEITIDVKEVGKKGAEADFMRTDVEYSNMSLPDFLVLEAFIIEKILPGLYEMGMQKVELNKK